MDTANSQHLSRISKMLLAGTGVAFAWLLLSLALGFTASQAHADDGAGVLGAVSGTVSDAAGGVTAAVSDSTTAATGVAVHATTAVVETVAPVVESVAAIAPEPVIAPIVESVAAPVVHTVTDVADSGVVAPVVESALAVVDVVPVIGSVVSQLGVTGAVSSIGVSVDRVITGGTEAISGAVTPVIGSSDPLVPRPLAPPLIEAIDGVSALAPVESTAAQPGAVVDAAVGAFGALLQVVNQITWTSWASMSPGMTASFASSAPSFVEAAAGSLLGLLRSVVQTDSVLVGPGGAGPGAWVLVTLGFVVAYRAWMRRSGLENDLAPPAPAFSADVSPD